MNTEWMAKEKKTNWLWMAAKCLKIEGQNDDNDADDDVWYDSFLKWLRKEKRKTTIVIIKWIRKLCVYLCVHWCMGEKKVWKPNIVVYWKIECEWMWTISMNRTKKKKKLNEKDTVTHKQGLIIKQICADFLFFGSFLLIPKMCSRYLSIYPETKMMTNQWEWIQWVDKKIFFVFNFERKKLFCSKFFSFIIVNNLWWWWWWQNHDNDDGDHYFKRQTNPFIHKWFNGHRLIRPTGKKTKWKNL